MIHQGGEARAAPLCFALDMKGATKALKYPDKGSVSAGLPRKKGEMEVFGPEKANVRQC